MTTRSRIHTVVPVPSAECATVDPAPVLRVDHREAAHAIAAVRDGASNAALVALEARLCKDRAHSTPERPVPADLAREAIAPPRTLAVPSRVPRGGADSVPSEILDAMARVADRVADRVHRDARVLLDAADRVTGSACDHGAGPIRTIAARALRIDAARAFPSDFARLQAASKIAATANRADLLTISAKNTHHYTAWDNRAHDGRVATANRWTAALARSGGTARYADSPDQRGPLSRSHVLVRDAGARAAQRTDAAITHATVECARLRAARARIDAIAQEYPRAHSRAARDLLRGEAHRLTSAWGLAPIFAGRRLVGAVV